jgi:hypothetical protein
MTTLLPAAMLAEEVEQTLANNTDPNRRWQVTAARGILEHGCLGEGTGRSDPGLVFRRLTLLVLLTR